MLDLTPSELSRAEAEEIMRTLRNGAPWSGEFLVRTRDGTRFNAQVTDIPVHDADGQPLGIVCTSRRTGYPCRI